MGLRINQNIAALNAQRNLTINDSRLAVSIERLSSGLRINRGADDPSGLVLSELLRSQVSGLDVGLSNATEGVNLVKTAEGALNEVSALLRQMRDLALDAASEGNNDEASRAALQQQVASALASIDDIAANTQYGSKRLLDGSAGTSATVLDTTNIASAQAVSDTPAGYIDIDVTTAATKAAATTDVDISGGIAGAHTVSINQVSISLTDAMTQAQVRDAINAASAETHVTAAINGNFLDLAQTQYGSDNGIVLVDNDAVLNSTTAVTYGIDAAATITYGDATTEDFNAGQGLQLVGATSGMVIALTEAGNGLLVDPQDAIYVTQGEVQFQVGNDAGQKVAVSIPSVATSSLGVTGSVANIDISTVAGADAAIPILDEAIQQVSTARGDLGAFQVNQLEATIHSLGVARENLAASESAIRDADFAAEVVSFTRNQILAQAGTAILAQANALPQNVLRLLQ
jgi:flagellin